MTTSFPLDVGSSNSIDIGGIGVLTFVFAHIVEKFNDAGSSAASVRVQFQPTGTDKPSVYYTVNVVPKDFPYKLFHLGLKKDDTNPPTIMLENLEGQQGSFTVIIN
jgi:hypothetical protein